MVTENEVLEEGVNQEEVSEEAQDELDYDKEFEAQWGNGTDDAPVSNEPMDEDDHTEEVAGAETSEPDDAGSTPHEGESQEQITEPAADPDDPYSWIDSLPEEVKEQAAALKHRALSDQGRVAAYNRRLNDLQAEVDRMNSRQTPATAAKANEPESAAPELPEKFKQLKEDFPEFADAVEEIRQYDREVFRNELDEKLKPLEQVRADTKKTAFKAAVSEAASEIFNTEETGVYWEDVVRDEDFSAWLQEQPQSVQNAAQVPDPNEAIYVLRQYERDYQEAIAAIEAESQQSQPATNQAPAPARADKVKSKRQQRQRTSVTPGSKPIISDPNNEGGDYESEFDRQWG